MRRLLIIAAVLTPLLATVAPAPAKAQDVGFSIRIGDRYRGSSLYFRNSPRMYVVPGTRVYYVRDADLDVYRYGRFYYAFEDGRWYRARSYRGPWIHIRGRQLPRPIFMVPARYRRHWSGDWNYWRNRDWDDRWDRRRDRDRDYRDRDRDWDRDRDRDWRRD